MTQDLIARKWTHAHEEDANAGAQVYRPSEGKFPMSRGRQKLDLSSIAGRHRAIGADEKYVDTGGIWALSDDGKVLTFTPNDSSIATMTYEVMSLSKDKLVLKRQF